MTARPEHTPDDIVIVAAARTPQGRLSGQLAALTAPELGAAAIAGALSRSAVPPEAVDAVILGHVLSAGVGQNPARQAALGAGLSWRVHASSVNKVCLSGLTAIIDAARMISAGDAAVVVAGGMESMTRAPHLLPGSRVGWRYGSIEALDHLAYDGLTDATAHESMGACTERDNERFGVSRLDQDTVAALSHQRASRAIAEGVFDDEIVPVAVPQRRGDPVLIRHDEGVREGVTVAGLAALPGAFSPAGTVTAGNASQISDGAAAVVLTTRAHAQRLGWTVLAALGASGQTAGPDASLQLQPSDAIGHALRKQGISATELDMIEINEAFGAVVAASTRALGVDSEIVNPHGGGIALGHPIGASGARLVVHLAWQLHRRGGGIGAVGLCGGGGQGEALILTA